MPGSGKCRRARQKRGDLPADRGARGRPGKTKRGRQPARRRALRSRRGAGTQLTGSADRRQGRDWPALPRWRNRCSAYTSSRKLTGQAQATLGGPHTARIPSPGASLGCQGRGGPSPGSEDNKRLHATWVKGRTGTRRGRVRHVLLPLPSLPPLWRKALLAAFCSGKGNKKHRE